MDDSGISHSTRQGEVFSFPTVVGIGRGGVRTKVKQTLV